MGCPWSGTEVCVVLTQLVREVGYMVLTLWFKLKNCLGTKRPPIGKPGPKMPLATSKRVCFVRHGQGEHNRSPQYWGLVDSQLNEAGKEQARALHKRLAPDLPEFDLVAVSPLSRAVQTMQFGFKGCKAPITVQPLLRERLGAPCDFGRPRTELLAAFPEMRGWQGSAEMKEVWWSESFEANLPERVEALKAWIDSRPEKTIAVVGHGGLFSRILGYHLPNCGTAWVRPAAPHRTAPHRCPRRRRAAACPAARAAALPPTPSAPPRPGRQAACLRALPARVLECAAPPAPPVAPAAFRAAAPPPPQVEWSVPDSSSSKYEMV